MEPILPDSPVEGSEFDLDIRLHAVARHVSDERGEKLPHSAATCGASCGPCATEGICETQGC
jgi:hypothetical protein